jgi:hypothetical protein
MTFTAAAPKSRPHFFQSLDPSIVKRAGRDFTSENKRVR